MIEDFTFDTDASPENMNMIIKGINKHEEDISGLKTSVEEVGSQIGQKLDKSGGEITGDLVLNAGLAHVKNDFFSRTNVYKISEPNFKAGILKIITPPEVRLFANTIFRLNIRGVSLKIGQMGWELIVGGYTRNQYKNIDCPTAVLIGSSPFNNVRFANDNGRFVILLGDVDTQWNHMTAISIDVETTFMESNLWGGVWSHDFITSDTGLVALASPSLKYGGIHSRGVNSNGEWIRFEDGTQICFSKMTLNTSVNALIGSIYVSSGNTWTFPANFLSYGNTNGNVYRSSSRATFCYTTSGSASSTTVFIASTMSEVNADYVLNLIAVGRWK